MVAQSCDRADLIIILFDKYKDTMTRRKGFQRAASVGWYKEVCVLFEFGALA